MEKENELTMDEREVLSDVRVLYDFLQGILAEEFVLERMQKCVAQGGESFTEFSKVIKKVFGERVDLNEFYDKSIKMLKSRSKMMDDIGDYLESMKDYSDYIMGAFGDLSDSAEA